MGILDRILISADNGDLVNLIYNSIGKSVNIGREENCVIIGDEYSGVSVFSRITNGFDFFSKGVSLSFKLSFNGNQIIITNDHRINRGKKNGEARKLLSKLISVFKLVGYKLGKKELLVVFEIRKLAGTNPSEVKNWLLKLGYEKDNTSKQIDKYIKKFEI